MAPKLPTNPIIRRTTLVRIGEARLREARALLEAGEYSGAVYLAGYAVECHLKAAICVRLDWESLLATFKTHDLEGLLLYTGLQRKLRNVDLVRSSFTKIVGLWNGGGREPVVRYDDPASLDQQTAQLFMSSVEGVPEGVIPWLQKAIS